MPDIYLPLKGSGLERVRLDQSNLLGEGGEAEVFDLGATVPGKVFKLFKPPTHADFAGDDEASTRNRDGAKARIAEMQRKLKDFPSGLPPRVIAPNILGYAKDGKVIVGFGMDAVRNAVTFRDLCQSAYRTSAGVSNNDIVTLFRDLHGLVTALHKAGVVIGDFNYLNVLAKNLEAFCIDADSMQFGSYFCRSFTTRFVDPRICDPKRTTLVMNAPHTPETDWYAFALMFFEALLLVHPYGGVYRPKAGTKPITQDARPLHRISVFSPDVIYPKKQMPIGYLPDELLHYMTELLKEDRRGDFPFAIIDDMRWTTCSNCGTEHARGQCPSCQLAAPVVAKKFVRRGNVSSERLFDTMGRILTASFQEKLRYLFHHNNEFRREDGGVVLNGPIRPGMRSRIAGANTLVSMGDRTVLFKPGKPPEQLAVSSYRGRFPVFDGNERFHYWLHQGSLYRSGAEVPTFIGNVVREHSLFWVGSDFGFGFYRAGELQRGFVFDAVTAGINDSVEIPPLRGELIDAACVFTSRRCWFFAASQDQGRTINRCAVISPDGTVTATAEGEEGDGSWLGSLRGKAAVTLRNGNQSIHALFAATPTGLVRVAEQGRSLRVTAEFPDTLGLVEEEDRIFLGQDGLFVVSAGEIDLLKLG